MIKLKISCKQYNFKSTTLTWVLFQFKIQCRKLLTVKNEKL